MTSESGRRHQIIIVAFLIIAVYFALAYGIYATLTQFSLGANDFYSRWMGTRALLLRGDDPYSDAVTREIQMGMYGRLARPDEDQVAFAYPLYVSFLIAPTVALSYAQAQAVWMAFLIMAIIGGIIALLLLNQCFLRPLTLGMIVLGTILFYPSIRGIFLGQVAHVSFFCFTLAALSIKTNHDILAGVMLAVATIKPQIAIFLVPVTLVWAVWHRRPSIVVSALCTIGLLVGFAFVLVPPWVGEFIVAMVKYSEYTHTGAPVQTLSEWLLPRGWFSMTLLFGLLLLAWLGWLVVRTLKLSWEDFQPTLGYAALVTTLMAGRIGTPDQIILLILWMIWFCRWWQDRQYGMFALATLSILCLPWAVFFMTLQGDTEYAAVTLVLPLLTLVIYLWREIISIRPDALVMD